MTHGFQSCWSGLILILTASISAAQEPGRIDFRNFIAGQLDAPVYEADGVTGLEGERYVANLTVLCCSTNDIPPTNVISGIAASRFQVGNQAGYWLPEIVRIPIPFVAPGERGWFQIKILDRPPWLDGNPVLLRAATEPFAVQLGAEPVPLLSLRPIVLNPFPAVIDFRNQVPGVLDAPVYETDGVTRLEGFNYWVQIFVDFGPFNESGPTALELVGSSYFQTGESAGYWAPKLFAVHGRFRDGFPGERMWAQIKVFDHSGQVQRGTSEPFRLNLESSTRLLGLKSFSLGNPPPEVDFRNHIEGILDAPVYRADGTNRLSGTTGCMGELIGGLERNAMWPLAVLPFGTDRWAGYVGSTSAVPVVLPFAKAGDRVWFWVRAWEPYQHVHIPEVFPPHRFVGHSEVFSVVVSNTLTPLIGLKSFRLQPASINASYSGNQLALRWSAGDGTVMYELEEASSLDGQFPWRSSSLKPVLKVQTFDWTWTADWVLTNGTPESGKFYRLKLLSY